MLMGVLCGFHDQLSILGNTPWSGSIMAGHRTGGLTQRFQLIVGTAEQLEDHPNILR